MEESSLFGYLSSTKEVERERELKFIREIFPSARKVMNYKALEVIKKIIFIKFKIWFSFSLLSEEEVYQKLLIINIIFLVLVIRLSTYITMLPTIQIKFYFPGT